MSVTTRVLSESESGSVVNDERVLNALTRPCVSLSAEPGGSGLAVLGVWGGRRSGIRALGGSFLRGLRPQGRCCCSQCPRTRNRNTTDLQYEKTTVIIEFVVSSC